MATAAWVICITSTTATTFPSAASTSVSEVKMIVLRSQMKPFLVPRILNYTTLPLSTTGRCKNFPSCIVCSASTIGVSTDAHSGFGVMTFNIKQRELIFSSEEYKPCTLQEIKKSYRIQNTALYLSLQFLLYLSLPPTPIQTSIPFQFTDRTVQTEARRRDIHNRLYSMLAERNYLLNKCGFWRKILCYQSHQNIL